MRTMISALVIVLGLVGGVGCDPAEDEFTSRPSGPELEVTPRDGEDEGPPFCDEPGRVYVSQNPAFCQQVLFICQADMTVFTDECGCGCEPLEHEDAPQDDEVVLADRP